ncbi:hypothetical protein [Pedobacter jeongneungensis]|uniref:hypothetical protein n=1 Tax=Pedobacter jeongneungensis TaxID=947309 RepID=UPI000467F6D4|nr:hypothetical protein [Pedobacter jeongneungensis]
MRRVLVILAYLLGAVGPVFAQNSEQLIKKSIIEGENEKSMGRQQILTNYLQGVAKNLTSNEKEILLKANLFALDPMDSVSKYKSENYLKKSFQRNTQLLIGGGVDKNTKINSFTIGLSYNLLNKRDPSNVNVYQELLSKPDYDQLSRKLMAINFRVLEQYKKNKWNAIAQQLNKIAADAKGRNDVLNLKQDILDLLPSQLRDGVGDALPFQNSYKMFEDSVSHSLKNPGQPPKAGNVTLFAEFLMSEYFATPLASSLRSYLSEAQKEDGKPKNTSAAVSDSEFNKVIGQINDELAKNTTSGGGITVESAYQQVRKIYDDRIKSIQSRPLLTLGYNYKYTPDAISHQHIPVLDFLLGFGKNGRKNNELVISLSDTLGTDTISVNKSIGRNVTNLNIGINRILFKDKSLASLLELKFALEERLIWSGRLSSEKRDAFFASATLQGRPSSKSPWLKLVVKYNKDAKFLGFLDVTLNLDNKSK